MQRFISLHITTNAQNSNSPLPYALHPPYTRCIFGLRYNKPKKPSEIKNPVYATDIQWNFNLAYAVTYANEQRQSEFSNNSLMFSGDIQLTPKWGMGVSSGYDFKNQGFTLTQIRIDRDLNDFRLNFDWTPFGAYERWYFFIGIKSSMLSDLKWEKRNQR